MPVTSVLRPVSVRQVGAGVAVPSGTLASVTSDDSDATYIQFPAASSSSNWNLRVESHTLAAGYQRHQIRGRVRIRADAGSLIEDIDLGRGSENFLTYTHIPVTSSFSEQLGDWSQLADFGLASSGPLADLNIGGGWLASTTGGATLAQTSECYVDIDCRLWPTYSPEVRDAAGVNRNSSTVTDTNQPTLYVGGVGYDDLPAADWEVTVRLGFAGGPIMFEASGSGVPPASVDVTTGLADDLYWAVWIVRSTIRGGDPFEHKVQNSFTIQNTVPAPSPPLVTATPEYGGYRVEWTNPGGQGWNDDYVVAEVYRDDCTGTSRIATVPDGINGSYLDLAIPQLDPIPGGPDCEVSAAPCDITYRVRYIGYVSATTIELPNTIPEELILAWPGTAASIPSGWTRVPDLDGYYPRGTPSETVNPGATGGAASHSHTTPGHLHVIGAHSHGLGGNTSTTSTSLSSPRYNGGEYAQSEDPHYHTRPATTGTKTAQNSFSTAPGTSVANNLPLTREVIWVKSDGTQASYPIGILGFSAENVSGWTKDAASNGRFLRGAVAGGNGGASNGSTNHTHTVNSHTHNGFNHDHPISATGLALPYGDNELGIAVGTPEILGRHNHPMDVGTSSIGNLTAAGGGTTGAASLEPPHRRVRVLRNTNGGIQTRIIGLYLGAISALDPTLTYCNGANGTMDIRGRFARDQGSDSINSSAGGTNHVHSIPNHTHGIPSHIHTTSVGASTGTRRGRIANAPVGQSPTIGHTHTSGNTAAATPSRSSSGADDTNPASNIPPYREVHFVRLDGTVVNDPLDIPELRTSDFSSVTVPSFTYADDLDRLSSMTEKIAVTTDRSHDYPRLVADSIPLDGGFQTVSVTLAGEDMDLTIAVVGLPAIDQLERVLANDRVYWSPVGGTPGWYAPAGWAVASPAPDVKVVQVSMVRQPWPATPDPEVYL